MRSILSIIALGVSWASLAVASRPKVPRAPAIAATEDYQYATGWFDQLLDHDKPELGTFKQRYFWSTEYWKGPGSPVDSLYVLTGQFRILTQMLGYPVPTGRGIC
jgi:hypothetical protein